MADKSITINIRALVKGLADLKSLATQLAKLRGLSTEIRKIGGEFANIGSRIEGLKKDLQSFNNFVKGFSKLEEAARKAGVSLRNTTDEAHDLAGGARDIGNEVTIAGDKTKKLGGAVSDLQAKFQTAEQAFQRIGSALTNYITKPMAAAIAFGTKAAADLQTQVANISAIRPDLDTSKLFQSINKLQREIPFTLEQIGAEVYDVFSSLDGISQEAALMLTQKLGKGATGALTDIQTFGTSVIGVLNAYHLTVDQVDQVMDVFFNTVNRGVVTGAELAHNLGDVTSAAKLLGVDFGTLGAAIAAVTKEGGSAAENITFLKNVFTHFGDAETQEKLKKGLGVDVFDPVTHQARDFVDVIGEIKVALDKLTPESRAKAISEILPDIRGRAGLEKLISQFDSFKKFRQENVPGGAGAGSAEAAFQKQFVTFNVQMTLLKQRLLSLLVEIGAKVLPIIVPIITAISQRLVPFVERLMALFGQLPTPVKIIIAALAAAVTVLGPLLLLAAALTPIIAAIAIVGAKLSLVIGIVVAALAAWSAVITGLVIAALIAWKNNLGGIRETVYSVFSQIKSFVTGVMQDLQEIYDRVMPTLQEITRKVLGAIAAFWNNHGQTIKEIVYVVWGTITGIIRGALRVIGDVIEAVVKLINGDWKGAWDAASLALWDFLIAVGNITLFLLTALSTLFVKLAKVVYEGTKKLGKWFIDTFIYVLEQGIPKLIATAVAVAIALSNPVVTAAFIAAAARNGKAYRDRLDAEIRSANSTAGSPAAAAVAGAFPSSTTESEETKPGTPKPPKGLGTFTGGGGSGKGKKEQFAAERDQLARAEEEKEIALIKDKNDRLLKLNDVAYQQQLRSFAAFNARKLQLIQANIDEEITARNNALARIETQLAKAKRPEDQERLKTERVNLQKEIELLTRQRNNAAVDAQTDQIAHTKELNQQYRDMRAQLLSITNQQRDAADIDIEDKFEKPLAAINVEMKELNTLLAEMKTKNADTKQIEHQLRLLQGRKDLIDAIKAQMRADEDYKQVQRELADVEEKRKQREQDLKRAIEFEGVSAEEQTRRRLELEKLYAAEIAGLITKLEKIAALSKDPAVQKMIDQLKSDTRDAGKADLNTQRQEAERRTNLILTERGILLDRIDRQEQQGTISHVRAEMERRKAMQQYRDALLKALQDELDLAEAQKDPQRAAEIRARREAIEEEDKATESWGQTLRATIEDTVASGLTDALTDWMTGAKSFKDAMLDMARSVLAAVIQLIVKMLVLKTLMKVFGMAGGGAVGDEDGKGFAGGGKVLRFPGGGHLRSGPGTSTSDSIPARLSVGEFVQPARAVRYYGARFMEALRQRKFPRFNLSAGGLLPNISRGFATGGAAIPESAGFGASRIIHFSQSIHIEGVQNPNEWERSKQQVARDIGRVTHRGIQRVA